MKLYLNDPPREFGPLDDICLKDCGTIELAPDEQLTFRTGSGRTNDIVRKTWGFYLGNSLNSTMTSRGLRLALVVSYASEPPRTYLNLVEREKMSDYEEYCEKYRARVICWLDDWFSEIPNKKNEEA